MSKAGELEKRMASVKVEDQKHIDDLVSSSDSSDSNSDDPVSKS